MSERPFHRKTLHKTLPFFLVTFFSLEVFAEYIQLTPEKIKELALKKSSASRTAELENLRSRLPFAEAKAEFDLQISFSTGLARARSENAARDSELVSEVGLSKKIAPSGTLLTLGVDTQVTGASGDVYSVGLRQPVWRNAFGIADRLKLDSGVEVLKVAKLRLQEEIEGVVLQALVLYWSAHVAGQQLKEHEATFAKYEKLVRNVRQRAGLALAVPGELPRLQAELENARQRVESSRLVFQNALGELKVFLHIAENETVEIRAPLDLQEVPAEFRQKVEFDDLRLIQAAQIEVQRRELELSAVKSRSRASVDFIARSESSASISESRAGYFIGLEFSSPLEKDLFSARIEDAEVAKSLVQTESELRRRKLTEELSSLRRETETQRKATESARLVVDFRSRVVREIEAAYRQGRQPLVELIRAYNDLSVAEVEKARAFGQYQISISRYLAARDQLISR